MRVLIIGGTRFIGPYVANALIDAGHEVALAHRGRSIEIRAKQEHVPDLQQVNHIIFDRRNINEPGREGVLKFNPDVVVDMCCITEEDATSLLDLFGTGIKRYVLVSSCDVYRAYGVLIGKEEGLEPMPLTEQSALRSELYPYRGEEPRAEDDPRRILDDYDKIPAEQAVLNADGIEGVVMRLPMVYGPGDYQHRLRPYADQFNQGVEKITLASEMAAWEDCRGFVGDIGQAIMLGATHPAAAGNAFNVADPDNLSELNWVKEIARAMDWNGEIEVKPAEELPEEERPSFNAAQFLIIDSSKIRNELGYAEGQPRIESIKQTVKWELAALEAEKAAQAEAGSD